MKQILSFSACIFFLLPLRYSFARLKDDYSANNDSLIQKTNPGNFNGVILIRGSCHKWTKNGGF